MELITKEYLLLFNIITDTTKALQALQLQLLAAQMQAESLFLGASGICSDDAVAFTQDKQPQNMVS